MHVISKSKTLPRPLLQFRSPHSYSQSTDFPANFINPSSTSFSQILKQRPLLHHLKQIHAQTLTQALSLNPHFISSLIHSYLFRQDLTSATILFDNYPSLSPPTLLWNLIIRAHSKRPNHSLESIKFFARMLRFRQPPDDYTYTFVVTSCCHHGSPMYGEIVHGMIVKDGVESDLFVSNSLINMLCVFGRLDDARRVFGEMPVRDVFSWTSLLGGYAKHGVIDKACQVFDMMPLRNDVSWAVMISGLVGSQNYVEALNYFRRMLSESNVRPNEAVLVCALSACAHLGALDQGNWIHVYINRNGFSERPNICTSLIDMYAKCGNIDRARRVFDKISGRDVHNYTSMIWGLSNHGLGTNALQVFSQMLVENVKPNEITILGILKGCSHSGLVEEGTSVFNSVEDSWGIVPSIEHYGCYVDLLGRAGHLEKAFEVAKTMPMEPDIVIWRALLSACKIHRNVNLGKQIIDHIQELDPSGYRYGQVLLSNLYASLGKWESVVELRNQIGERNRTSDLGCSWIEVNGVVHEFHVDDQFHPQISEIRKELNEILKKARLGGYVADTMQVTFDLSGEDKEQAVARHSEKLAIAFGLLSSKPGSLIRIVKNLRTCDDCHSALKAISLVFDREIVVRDRSRFHTMKEGKCSCNDYWCRILCLWEPTQ